MDDELTSTPAPGDNIGADQDATSAGTQPLVEGAPTAAVESDTGSQDDDSEYVSPFAGKALDDIEKDPEVAKLVRDRQAKLEQSYKDREAAATAKAAEEARLTQYQQNVQQATVTIAGQAHARLRGIASAIEKGAHVNEAGVNLLESQWLPALARDMANDYFIGEHNAYKAASTAAIEKLVPGFKIPATRLAEIEQAAANFNPARMVDLHIQTIVDAVTENLSPKLRAQVEAELKAKGASDAELDKQRNNDSIRSGRTRPTNALAGAGTRDLDSIIEKARPGSPQWRDAMKEKYGELAASY